MVGGRPVLQRLPLTRGDVERHDSLVNASRGNLQLSCERCKGGEVGIYLVRRPQRLLQQVEIVLPTDAVAVLREAGQKRNVDEDEEGSRWR